MAAVRVWGGADMMAQLRATALVVCRDCVCLALGGWLGGSGALRRAYRGVVGQGSQPPSHKDVLPSRPVTAFRGGSCGARCGRGGPALPDCQWAQVVLPSRLGPSHGLGIRLGQWEGS